MLHIDKRLKEAAMNGNEEELKAVLRDTSCNALSKDLYGVTALMRATHGGHEGCCKILLPVSDVFAKDMSGVTALMQTAALGHEVCVSLLLRLSDTGARDDMGLTALMHAARRGEAACVRILLPKSDTEVKDEDGRTASDWAKAKGYEGLAEFINDYALARSEQTALNLAIQTGSPSKKSVRRV